MKPGINKTQDLLDFIRKTIVGSEELSKLVRRYEKGELLFSQGKVITHLYLVLDGEVTLNHRREDGTDLDLITLAPGHFVGLISYTTGNPTLAKVVATLNSEIFRVRQTDFDRYMEEYPRLRSTIEQLMLNNMAERFDKNLQLEAEMNALNLRLEEESEQLKQAYEQLEDSHQKLVHQEKMATLGELVAGFAHEVNNPAAALLRSSEMLKDNFLEVNETSAKAQVFQIGMHLKPLSSANIRERMKGVNQRFPQVTERSVVRKLAQMPDDALDIVEASSKQIPIPELIRQFEAGKFIYNIQVASERIANLVKSLKSYSRQDNSQDEIIDIRHGINDTVLILSHRLKYLDLQLDLQDIPKTCGKMGELNQVWTNILVNACDVLGKEGRLTISTKPKGKSTIIVEISDNGPGIPETVLTQIFEPNFTTKNQGAQFGLGLGLAISNQIIRQHGGEIKASNNPEGGARFTVTLPVKNC